MIRLIVILAIASLACGAPAYIAPTYQGNANTVNPYLTNTPEMPIRMVVLDPLTVRSAPCENSDEVGYLAVGDVVTVTETTICLEDGGTWKQIVEPPGWVNARYLEAE